jgi:hypothetical protein
MAIEVFQGGSIPRELSSSAMEFLWAKWKTLNATNSLSLQRLTEETSHPLRANATYVLSAGDDFVYMYVGDAIQAAAGFNATGQLVSASDSPIARDLLSVYRQAAGTLAPSFARFSLKNDGQLWQGLVLPIKLAPNTVLIFCYSELVSHQSEVCDYLFRKSRDAMLIASPIANEVGDVTDGWVVMINDAARELLDFRDGISNLRLKHLPALQGLDLRFRLHPPVPDGTTTHAVASQDIGADIIRFAHVFALRLGARADFDSSDQRNDAPALAPA